MEATLDATQLYLDHARLIDSRAYNCSTRYNVDFGDVRGKASEIFCKVVDTYDPELGKFSTLLYNALRALPDEIKKDRKKEAFTESVDEGEEYVDGLVTPSYQYEADRELLMSAEGYLSGDARLVLEHILMGTFEAQLLLSVQAPGIETIENYLKENWKWPRVRRILALNQIRAWYKEEVAGSTQLIN